MFQQCRERAFGIPSVHFHLEQNITPLNIISFINVKPLVQPSNGPHVYAPVLCSAILLSISTCALLAVAAHDGYQSE